MIEKTVEQFKDKDFQKWWARHPWRIVKVNGKKIQHINMLLVYSALLASMLPLMVLEVVDLVKWEGYKVEKTKLSENQLKEKYSEFQIVRYDAISKLQEKVK